MSQPRPEPYPARYLIEVDGIVDSRWAAWFDDLEVTLQPSPRDARRTTLIARLPDQSALPGLLARVTGLNLRVVSVTPFVPDPHQTGAQSPPEGESNE